MSKNDIQQQSNADAAASRSGCVHKVLDTPRRFIDDFMPKGNRLAWTSEVAIDRQTGKSVLLRRREMLSANHTCSDCCSEIEAIRSRVERFRVLYVGCDGESLTGLRQNLVDQEVQVVGCSERSGAILFLKSEIQYDALLFDVEWQGAEGLRLARMAHSLRHRKQTPVILVAAMNLGVEREMVMRKTGAAECLQKTTDMAGVGEAVKEALRSLR